MTRDKITQPPVAGAENDLPEDAHEWGIDDFRAWDASRRTAQPWKVGDRCVITLPDERGWRSPGRGVVVSGEVIGVDTVPGYPGVKIRFIQPKTVSGLTTCYATHDEPRRV